MSQQSVSSTVSGLLFLRSPSAVAWAVALVVVASLDTNAVPSRLGSHVFEEGGKRLLPASTDANPSFAIMFVARIGAPGKHGGPVAVFRCAAQAVRCVLGYDRVFLEATAAPRGAISKAAALYCATVSACALAEPHGVSLRVFAGVPNDCQPTERGMSRQVFHTGRNGDRLRFSHERSPESGLARMAGQLQLAGRSHCNPSAGTVL